jgi:hypothetical protein
LDVERCINTGAVEMRSRKWLGSVRDGMWDVPTGRFIDRFSQIVEPLHALKRKSVRFVRGDVQQSAFQQLKEVLATPPV